MTPPMLALASGAAVMGTIVTFAFGGWTEALTVLVVAMGIDYVAAIAAAIKCGKGLNSNVGFWGLARKGLSLLVILLAHRIDVLMDSTGMVMNAAVYFYLVNELVSIAEKYGKLGLPFPPVLRRVVELLRDAGQIEDAMRTDQTDGGSKPKSGKL